MAEFFSMGGYAAYVWPAYGIAAVILVAMLIVSLPVSMSRRSLGTRHPFPSQRTRGTSELTMSVAHSHEPSACLRRSPI